MAAGGTAGDESRHALCQLCEAYWYPLYAYIRRRVGQREAAQDLTQGFFLHLLEKHAIAHADRNRGRFRAFLLTAAKNFLTNEWEKARAEKRGGDRLALALDFDSGESRYQIEPAHDVTPDKLYERRWVLTLLDQVLQRLRSEFVAAGKEHQFEQLKGALTGEATATDYEQTAQTLGMTPAAVKQAVYRLRKRYRQLFREEVARTVADETEVDQEMQRLLETLVE